MTSLLWVEDDASLRRVIRPLLRAEGYRLTEAEDAPGARAALEDPEAGLVLLDLMLPPTGRAEEGLGLLREALRLRPDRKVIVLTGSGDRQVALEAIRRGAHDFLHKPVDPEVLLVVLRRAASRLQLESELSGLRVALAEARPREAMVGQSAVFRACVELTDRVAPTDLPILITGENGTGKELIARRLHEGSRRARGPFLAVNCGALPPTLLESTLFGHQRGAFTGADRARKGVFQEADGGTLFLDEVGDLELATQVRLLRALESQEVVPVGSDRPVKVDLRFVSATHRDLEQMLSQGTFRDDLYWRLKGVQVHLPPLRDRGTDVTLLARHFLSTSSAVVGRSGLRLSPEAEAALAVHSWPGNLRELRHVVQRGMVLCGSDGWIRPEHLGLPGAGAAAEPDGSTLGEQVERLERRALQAALAAEGGNRSRAARRLGLSRQGLLNKLDRYGMDRGAEDGGAA